MTIKFELGMLVYELHNRTVAKAIVVRTWENMSRAEQSHWQDLAEQFIKKMEQLDDPDN